MKLLRFLPLLLLVASCNTINKSEQIPAFIRIDRFDIDPGFLGSRDHNITDAWITVDNEFIGIFELPTIIPVLKEGVVEVNISAGIQNLGIAEQRIDYPLTKNFNITITLVPEETIEIEPTLTYFDELVLNPASENFGGSSIGFSFNNGFINTIEDSTLDSSPLNDEKVGQLKAAVDEHLIEITSANPIPVTPEGPTMLEFNYLADHTFQVGLKHSLNGSAVEKEYLIGLNPSYEDDGSLGWRKIYINLESAMDIFNASGNAGYLLFFESDTENQEVNIRLDNIKIISL